MEELRLAFLVLGACAIAGILIHGLWTVRKNANRDKQTYEPRDWSEDDDDQSDFTEGYIDDDMDAQDAYIDIDDPLLTTDEQHGQFDELGLGQVRVVSQSNPDNTNREKAAGQQGDSDQFATTDMEDVISSEQRGSAAVAEDTAEKVPVEKEQAPEKRIYSSVVSQPKPEYLAQQQAIQARSVDKGIDDDLPEPPPSLLKKAPVEPAAEQQTTSDTGSASIREARDGDVQPTEKSSLAEQARKLVSRKKAEPKPRKRREPKIGDDQMRIDFDEPHMDDVDAARDIADEQPGDAPQQEVLVLNVKAQEEQPILGSALLPMLLTLGFKFGDQDIFHRHVNSNGKGPVLFSLANMFKPGVFDIDNLENFKTMGVSLFMILPIEGDPHQVFNMMHNAARKIADEFNAQVLDGRRSALTKQSLQQYVEKIREFERKRMIAR